MTRISTLNHLRILQYLKTDGLIFIFFFFRIHSMILPCGTFSIIIFKSLENTNIYLYPKYEIESAREIKGTASIVIKMLSKHFLAADEYDDQHRHNEETQFVHFNF